VLLHIRYLSHFYHDCGDSVASTEDVIQYRMSSHGGAMLANAGLLLSLWLDVVGADEV
jgi:hypothetical protein